MISKLQDEFQEKHLSGNLIRTVDVIIDEDNIRIEIPAPTYNMLKYQKEGVVVHTNHGSYASKLDIEGSSFMIYPNDSRKGSFRIHPGNHQGFVDKVLKSAIQEWLGQLQDYKGKITEE
jgi:hypothetical protein